MRVHIFSTAYANARVLEAGIEALWKSENIRDGKYDAHHYVLNQHYPIGREAVDNLLVEYRDANEPWVTLADAGRNLGLHGGLNFLMGAFG